MDKNEISMVSVTILSGAAAAMGPMGIPAFIGLATLGAILSSYGTKEEGRPPITEEQVANVVKAHFAENSARTAWAKIQTSYEYYEYYVDRAKGGEEFSERDLQQLDNAINDATGPNSALKQALGMLYRKDQPNDFQYVEHNLPIYMLGASIHIQYRLLDIARQELGGETIVQSQWQSLADLAATYEKHIRHIASYVKNMTIEKILTEEINKGKLTINSPELRKRSEALHQHYLGSDKDYREYLNDLEVIHRRLKETARLES